MRLRGPLRTHGSVRVGAWAGWAGVLLALLCLMAGCGSANNGWQQLVAGGDESIVSLAVDPANANLIFAGSSTGAFYRGNGSSLGVPTKSSTGLPKFAPINVILADPSAPDHIFAATNSGLYVSRDVGDTWSPAGTGGFPSGDVMEALSFGANTRTLFAGTEQHGVYASHDAGKTWQQSSAGLPNAQIYTLLYDSNQHTLYAGLVGNGVYASTDEAATWSQRSSGLPSGDDVFMFLILKDSGLIGNGPTLYAATAKGLYGTTDGGQNWRAAGTGIPSGRVLSLASDPARPGTMYAGTDDAVYQSRDGGQHWSGYVSGLKHQVAAIAVTPGAKGVPEVFAAAGALYRYPPMQGTGNALTTILPVVVIAGLLVFVILRQRRTKQQLTAREQERRRRDLPPAGPDGTPASAPDKWDSPSR